MVVLFVDEYVLFLWFLGAKPPAFCAKHAGKARPLTQVGFRSSEAPYAASWMLDLQLLELGHVAPPEPLEPPAHSADFCFGRRRACESITHCCCARAHPPRLATHKTHTTPTQNARAPTQQPHQTRQRRSHGLCCPL